VHQNPGNIEPGTTQQRSHLRITCGIIAANPCREFEKKLAAAERKVYALTKERDALK